MPRGSPEETRSIRAASATGRPCDPPEQTAPSPKLLVVTLGCGRWESLLFENALGAS